MQIFQYLTHKLIQNKNKILRMIPIPMKAYILYL